MLVISAFEITNFKSKSLPKKQSVKKLESHSIAQAQSKHFGRPIWFIHLLNILSFNIHPKAGLVKYFFLVSAFI